MRRNEKIAIHCIRVIGAQVAGTNVYSRGRLDITIAELRKLYDTFTSRSIPDRVKAQSAFLTRVIEDPELLPLILDAAIGNLEAVEVPKGASETEALREVQPPVECMQRLRNGENPIKVYREYRRLTQGDLANRLGVSQPVIGRLEASGTLNCKLNTLLRIADSLNVSPADLIPPRGKARS